jgi:predicted ATPase
MSVINQISTMAYIASSNFFLVMYLKSMRWTLKYGYTDYSPVAISTYGLIVCSLLKDAKKGAEFGDAGLELGRVHILRLARATSISAIYGYVNHWSQPMRKSLLPLATWNGSWRD